MMDKMYISFSFLGDYMKSFVRLSAFIILIFMTACGTNPSTKEEKPFVQNETPIADEQIPTPVEEPEDGIKALPNLGLQAEAAILIHAEDGDILYDKNIDQSLPIASMSKIMSELLLLEAIEKGQIDWEDTVPISDYAYTISNHPGFASVLLEQNRDYTVRELFHAMAIRSANGATIALAEAVSGTEQDFVVLMNDKARQLGLEDTYIVNSTGLSNNDLGDFHSTGSPHDSNTMSASDLSKLAMYVIDQFPELLDIAKEPEFHFKGETYTNSNWMLPESKGDYLETMAEDVHFDGVDGLKTGFTDVAGYCFTGTVTIDGERFISVVMGTANMGDRFLETKILYDALSDQLNKDGDIK